MLCGASGSSFRPEISHQFIPSQSSKERIRSTVRSLEKIFFKAFDLVYDDLPVVY